MRVGVVGGGITGLSAAYRLQQRGADVTLYEGGARVGGLLGTECFDGYVMETGPDSILSEKPWALALAEELGLGDQIIKTLPGQRGAYIVHEGKLERVPEGFSLMAPTNFMAMARSPIVSMRGKLRMAADLVVPRRAGVHDESLESYVVRRLGREAFERLAQPLVGGIYGAEPSKLSLAATMPRFLEMEREQGSVIRGLKARQRKASPQTRAAEGTAGARYGLFAAFRGGMQSLIDALAHALGDRIQLGHMVTAIGRDRDGFSLETRGAWHAYDALLIALPAHVAGQVLYGLNAALAHKLFEIEYASAVTVTFSFDRADIRHPLDAYGFVVPAVEGRQIIASTWASVKYEGRAPAGKALLRVFIGGHKGQHLMAESDASLIEIAQKELSALLGIERAPEWSRLVRYPRAMPQYHVGHLERVAAIEALVAREPGLELAGNAYRGVGIPDAVRSAEQAVTRLLAAL